MPDPSQFNIDRTYQGLWTMTFSNRSTCLFPQRRIGSANDRPRGGPVREGRGVPVGESRFFRRPSRRSQGS